MFIHIVQKQVTLYSCARNVDVGHSIPLSVDSLSNLVEMELHISRIIIVF